MYHSRDLDNKNNNIHKRALRIAYQEKKIKFTGFIAEGQSCVYPHEKLTVFSNKNL